MNRQRVQELWRRWPVFLGLVIVWVALWGDLTLANVLAGMAVAAVVGLAFPLPPLPTLLRIRPVRLLILAWTFAWDLLVASVHVAWLAWRPGPPPRCAVIRMRLATTSEATMTVVGEMTSLVPGSIVLESDSWNRRLYLHCLDISDEDDVQKMRDRVAVVDYRVRAAFSSRAPGKKPKGEET